ncbi:MAG: MaoC family dehydratase N-terminal domain-containing protein [Methylobacteriaceae bacterium]|nr:MaoC family dehydratase N-terminal domain-containing protein [Methylobacteriaceae bacterium]
MLYALAIGAGQTGEAADLPFVYESGLVVAPSFAVTLAFDDSWIDGAGIDLAQVLHGGLDVAFDAPLAPSGDVEIAPAIVGLDDKGPGKGAIILQETRIAQNGALRAVVTSSLFVRGGGGFGGSTGRPAQLFRTPDRPPDAMREIATAANQALLFRLLGDRNPLHVDPAAARAAGFDRPILHGACTFGVACLAVLREVCGLDPARLKRVAARFAGVVYPGETLLFSFWREGATLAFRAQTRERAAPALEGGLAEFSS